MTNINKTHQPDYSIESLHTKVDHLTTMLNNLLSESKGIGDWLEEREVQRRTNLSRGTLLKLRKEGLLSSSSLSGKTPWYKISELIRLLNKNEMNR